MTKGSETLARLGRAGFVSGEQKTRAIQASIREGITRAFAHVRVLSIDAWRDGSSWTWNNWYSVGYFPLALVGLKPRALLREMRERGYLSDASRGRVSIDDDGYNIVICARGTGEPLFAIEYGAILN